MGLFDNLKNKVKDYAKDAVKAASNKQVEVVFEKLPETFEEFKALPQAALTDPFEVAALTVLALCFYPENKDLSLQMLDYLRGPNPLSTYDKQFLKDRFMDKDYVPRSYFNGATPDNNYVPSEPYTIVVKENPYSYENGDASGKYANLFIHSGGADSDRSVKMREAKDGKWYLWEQFLLADIRKPEASNPWA